MFEHRSTDSIDCHPPLEISQAPVQFPTVSLQPLAMLRYNLFTYRNLWEWIDSPYEVPPLVPLGEQLTLEFI